VKWQVAFFSIVPLALGTMTQPVGRVFDRPANERFWIRSSPLECVVDILLFWGAVLYHYGTQPEWTWRHYRSELAYRFRDEDFTSVDIEKATFGRWILILVGGIPCQTIKLVAMSGIPYTQTIALMFFISLLMGEVLNISAVIFFGRSGIIESDYESSLLQNGELLIQITQAMSMSTMTTLKGCLCMSATSALTFADMDRLLWTSTSITWFFLTLLGLMSLTSDIDMPASVHHLMPALSGSPYLVIVGVPDVVNMLIIIAYSAIVTPIILAAMTIFTRFTRTQIARTLGLPQTHSERSMLIFFLNNFLCTILLYAYTFDSSDTYNPSWVGVFG